MRTPYIIYGIVEDSGGGASASNSLTLLNESNNESISTISTTSGKFIFDLANLKNDYANDDFFRITGTGGSSTGQQLRFKAICQRDQAQIEELTIRYEV